MKRPFTLSLMIVFFVTLVLSSTVFADQEWIRDVLERKDRFVNIEVTVVGQVLAVQANPAGTTRGTYQIQDESTKDTLTVESKELPLVGKSYSVTGMVLIDPKYLYSEATGQLTSHMSSISERDRKKLCWIPPYDENSPLWRRRAVCHPSDHLYCPFDQTKIQSSDSSHDSAFASARSRRTGAG